MNRIAAATETVDDEILQPATHRIRVSFRYMPALKVFKMAVNCGFDSQMA
jgi:hypothetical protein